MLLSASLSWRCSGRRASGAFKSTGHVDSDIKAAVNSKQSREQTVELIITPEFIPDVSQFKLTLLSSRCRREVTHEKLLWSSWACTKWSLTKDASPLMCREETSVPAHVWVTSLALALALYVSAVSSQRLNWRITSPANWQFTYNLCCSQTKHF